MVFRFVPIVAIHYAGNAGSKPEFCGIGSFFYEQFRRVAFGGTETLQNKVSSILLSRRPSDAQPEPCNVFRRKFLQNVRKTFLAAGRPGGPTTDFSERQIHVVADDKYVICSYLKVPHNLYDRIATGVHVRQGFDEQNFGGVLMTFMDFCLEFHLGTRSVPASCQFGNHIEADIVTSLCILLAGISEPDNQLHGRAPE